MANIYVYSAAGGSASGADWANAKLTLQAALTAFAAGDFIWVAHDHAETAAAATTITKTLNPGLFTNVIPITCVNRAGSVPPVAADIRATGSISTTGNNALTLTGGCLYYVDGLIFSAGSGAVTAGLNIGSGASYGRHTFRNCAFRKLGTSVNASAINIAGSGALTQYHDIFENCTVQFGNVGDKLQIQGGMVEWRNTPNFIQGSIFPTNLIVLYAQGGVVNFSGVDFSALGSGKTIVPSQNVAVIFSLIDCKFNSAVTITNIAGSSPATVRVFVVRSDSGAINYRNELHDAQGDQTIETTIVRTGGATDGTTPVALKIVIPASMVWQIPFELAPIAIWNDTVGSAITITLEGIWGGGAVPNNDDIWMEAQYPGSTATPIASFATCGKASFLASNSALSAGSGTWGGSTTKFKMSVTVTPQMKGYIYLTIKAAKASTTFYIDPKPVVT